MGWSDTATATPKPLDPKPFNPWDNRSQDDVLLEWDRLKKLIQTITEQELEFRKYIVNRAFPQKHEGMNNLDLGNGYTLKGGVKFNYKLSDNATVEKTLDEIAKVGNQGSFVADRLISWKPNFLLTEYRELQKDSTEEGKKILSLIEKMLTIDDAAPSLEIKPPKGAK